MRFLDALQSRWENITSKEPRRCGLCYFHLKPETPVLEEPTVSRRALPGWPAPTWKDGSLDQTLEPAEEIVLIELKTKVFALHRSVDRGCDGCSVILRNLEQQCRDKGFALDEDCLQDTIEIHWLVGPREASEVSLGIHIETKGVGEALYRTESFIMMLGYTTRTPAHPAARQLPEAISLSYTGSPVSLQNLQSWLSHCDSSHQGCKSSNSDLPYRVLKVSHEEGGKIDVRLVQDIKTKEPYACLSHRWGDATYRCRTTQSTLSQHFESVPWDNLPKTFQEAAAVTLHLGLKYLWIDSLCIIQEDVEDWKVQAAQMCNIYQGSYVTIAATGSDDGSEGLFWRVPKKDIGDHGPTKRGLFLRQAPEHRIEAHPSAMRFDFPLLTRGWVYQERLLAPRVAHFSRYEIIFECLGQVARCECGIYGAGSQKMDHKQSLAASNLHEISNYWHDAMERYSALYLTYHSDCIAALAGIARQYGTAHGKVLGRYAAGMWQNTLLNDLLWYAANGYESNRPDEYCAPTWSWASVTASTRTLGLTRATDELEAVGMELEHAGPDEYGPLITARLKLRGCMIRGSWQWAPGAGEVARIHFYVGDMKTAAMHYLNIDYDLSKEDSARHVPEGDALYCLKTGFVANGSHVCLVLRALDGEARVFERVGLLLRVPSEEVNGWVEEGQEKETVTLV